MPIKHAEITISRNLEKETWICYYKRLLGEENIVNDNDTLIILFDDGTICDVKSENKKSENKKSENKKSENNKNKFTMGPRSFDSHLPLYFEIKDKNTFFSKEPSQLNGIMTLSYNTIFANNNKYLTSKKEPSVYNSIYYMNFYDKKIQDINKNDVLAIVRIKSSEENPRFLLVYDDDYFEKNDIIYFINYIFS